MLQVQLLSFKFRISQKFYGRVKLIARQGFAPLPKQFFAEVIRQTAAQSNKHIGNLGLKWFCGLGGKVCDEQADASDRLYDLLPGAAYDHVVGLKDMFDQPKDFCDESSALHALLVPLPDTAFDRPTQFKGWTINDIIGHLHAWNWAADASLCDENAFQDMIATLGRSTRQGLSLLAFEREWRGNLAGQALLSEWYGFCQAMTDRFTAADPKMRVKWVGPDMSVRSSITARLMESWAHGQAIYDLLGVERVDTDRIHNIAVLAVNTFGWSFANRGLPVPDTAPRIRLTAPSGAIWEWHAHSPDNLIEGSATQFCQVAAQTRHLKDTQLRVSGDIATRWIDIIQCFAGPPEEAPRPNTRFKASDLKQN